MADQDIQDIEDADAAGIAEPEVVPLAAADSRLADPRLSEVLALWRAARDRARAQDGAAVPPRSAFTPHTLGTRVLPNIALLDCVETDGLPDCRYRLVGTALVDAVGADHTGATIRARCVERAYAERLVQQAYSSVDLACPAYSAGHYRDGDGRVRGLGTKRLTLPIATPDVPRGSLLVVQVFSASPDGPEPPETTAELAYYPEAYVIFREDAAG